MEKFARHFVIFDNFLPFFCKKRFFCEILWKNQRTSKLVLGGCAGDTNTRISKNTLIHSDYLPNYCKNQKNSFFRTVAPWRPYFGRDIFFEDFTRFSGESNVLVSKSVPVSRNLKMSICTSFLSHFWGFLPISPKIMQISSRDFFTGMAVVGGHILLVTEFFRICPSFSKSRFFRKMRIYAIFCPFLGFLPISPKLLQNTSSEYFLPSAVIDGHNLAVTEFLRIFPVSRLNTLHFFWAG